MGRPAKDFTGYKFGYLTVLHNTGEKKWGKPLWACQCVCGEVIKLDSGSLIKNQKKLSYYSCGCYRSTRLMRHGGCGSRLYRIWKNIKTRCYNESTPHYHSHGGRGIKMYEAWRKDFKSFRHWALKNGYKHNLTIDRRDNDGNYSPDNCQWITNSRNSLKAWRDRR